MKYTSIYDCLLVTPEKVNVLVYFQIEVGSTENKTDIKKMSHHSSAPSLFSLSFEQ
jgi:hypothetical protein